MKTALFVMLLLAPVGLVAQRSSWRFESDPSGWQASFEQFRLRPFPPSLEKMRGIHPRLYLDTARIAALRQAIQTTHAPIWKEVRELADRAVKRGPPAYRERDNSSGDEQLWQRDVGNTLPVLAMAWALAGERPYLEAARKWALASCDYPTWGLGRIDGMDLAAGHQLFGLGLVYDWCYADLDDNARRIIRETLVKRTSAMFEAAATGKAWWNNSYLQNHLWVNIAGMAIAGLSLFDEVDNAERWIGLPLQKFQRTMAALGPDGASHEGAGYWEYGAEYMLKFMDLARTRLDVNLYTNEWWRNTALYAQYLALPRHAWTRNNCIVDIADCPRGHWYGPDYILRGIAREFHDGHAQWLAQQVSDAGVSSPGAPWLNLVWFDPALRAESPSSLATSRHFDDMGIVSARSDWSGDESLLVFKCGPYLGRKAVEEFSYDPGGGHVHPDANHFVLFGAGEWLIRDDGYRAKWTGQHNTLLVDGRGQLGEGKQWFQGAEVLALKARPKIVRASSTPDLDQITGEASEAYPRDLGLRRHLRHLLFLKPDVLLVCDEVITDKPRRLELRFHPESRQATKEGSAFVMRGAKSSLRLEPLVTTPDMSISTEDLAMEGREGELNQTMFTVRLTKQASVWRNAVAMSWSGLGRPIKAVKANMEGEVWSFSVDRRVVTLDWRSGLAQQSAETRPAAAPSCEASSPHSPVDNASLQLQPQTADKVNLNANPMVSGELKQWHKVTLTLVGPQAKETDNDPNPFTDYRMDVTFTHESGSPTYKAPGYFCADGNASETSATSGNKWRAHISPDKTGKWTYKVSFVKGKNVAVDDKARGLPVADCNGVNGSFTVARTDKAGRDFRAKGRLEYVGKHYLQFAGSKEYFLKAGPDAPETLLAYADFDGTEPGRKREARTGEAAPTQSLHHYAPHIEDWKSGDPTWKDGKGKGLIGVLNYLASKGLCSFSFIPYNAGGDGDNVWPFISRGDKLHYDCSKLDQWQIVFDHATKLGLYLHFKTQETENDDLNGPGSEQALDGGDLGPQRRLYYRELIARFDFELALNWNLGEENSQSARQQRAMAQYFHDTDPYRHLIVIHTFPDWQERVYTNLLGSQSALTGVSLQNDWNQAHQRTLQWVTESDKAGKPWVVANDEQGGADTGVPPDLGYAGYNGRKKDGKLVQIADDIRKATLWGNLMAGGAGVEYYFGYELPQNDMICEDFRSRDKSWDYCRIALEFFREHKIPFWEMKSADALVGNPKNDNSKYCFTKPGDLYLVYLPNGGTTDLDLSGARDEFTVKWFNPRTGGALADGSVKSVKGGGKVSLGNPLADAGQDWLIMVRK